MNQSNSFLRCRACDIECDGDYFIKDLYNECDGLCQECFEKSMEAAYNDMPDLFDNLLSNNNAS